MKVYQVFLGFFCFVSLTFAESMIEGISAWPEDAHDGKSYDIALDGNYAYVADGTGGLKVLDVSNPASPVLVNSVVTNNIRAVEVVDGYAYAACYEGVMLIFDVSNPSNIPPPVVSSPASYDDYLDIAVANGYAYLVDKDLEIWDVSTPSNPVRVATPYTDGFANNIKVVGDYAYIAEGQGGLRVYNVSNPGGISTIIIPTDTYDPGDYAYGVDVEWPYAYYANRLGGLVVVDVSDPRNIVPAGHYGDTAEKVSVANGFAYVTDNQGDVQMLDVRNPSSIVAIATCVTSGDTLRALVRGGTLFAANGTTGVSMSELRPTITAMAKEPSAGDVRLQVESFAGVPYAVERSSSLGPDANWMPFCSTNSAANLFSVLDAGCTAHAQFYRVRQLAAGYAEEVMADAPMAYYRFEEAPGTSNLTDRSGNGHDSLTLSNVTFGAEGLLGNAASFSNGYALLDLQLSPDAGDFSIEAIVRFDVTDTNRHIASQQDGTGQGRSLLYRGSDGKLASYLGGASTPSTASVSEGSWHHVVMTVDVADGFGTIRFYIDGVPVGEDTEAVEFSDGDWVLGAAKTYGSYLIGVLDEVAIYTKELSAKRIAEHYTALTFSGVVTGVSIAR